jgi:Phage virion morphogenesis family
MPQDNDICGWCRPPHAFREHDKKLRRGSIVKGTADKLLRGFAWLQDARARVCASGAARSGKTRRGAEAGGGRRCVWARMVRGLGVSARIQLKLQSFGFPVVASAIRQIILKVGHLQVPLGMAGKYLVTRMHQHFERHESPEGDPWQALAPATIAARQRRWARKGRGKRGVAASAMAALLGKTGLEPLFVTGRLLL